jgi:cysteine desulfurase/selenocysteine lyase
MTLSMRAQPPRPGIVYLNHAAGSIPAPPVGETLRVCTAELLKRGTADPELFHDWHGRLASVRSAIAAFVHAGGCEEVALTASGTDAINRLARSIPWESGDNIVLPDNEFVSNLHPWLRLKDRGVSVRRVQTALDGRVDLHELERAVDSSTRLITISHVPNSIGTLQPIDGIAEIAARHETWFHLNACPTIGQIPIDVSEPGCTFLSGCARKYLRGPSTGGFLYVQEDVLSSLCPPDLGWSTGCWNVESESFNVWKDARKLHGGNPLFPDWLALELAVSYIETQGGIKPLSEKIRALAEHVFQELKHRAYTTVYGPTESRNRSALVTFNVKGVSATSVAQALRERDIVVEAGHFLCPIPLSKNNASDAVRISVHYTNTMDELGHTLAILDELHVGLPER